MKRQVFSEFIQANLDSAYRFAYAYTKNQQTAEDVVSESVVKGFKSIGSLRQEAYLRTWFYRIIINTANTYFQKEKRVIPLTLGEEPLEGLLPDYYDDYSGIDFHQMLELLPPEKRIVIVLRFYEDYTLREMGEILSVNENTVKKRLYSSLETLRAYLEEEK